MPGPEDAASEWYKVQFMLKIWSLPQYKNVKWFVIAHDASYLNLANLWSHVSTLNHSIPQMIGDVYCTGDGTQYINGKGGIILSRAIIDKIDWYVFNWPLRAPIRRSDYKYDQFLGHYALRKNIPIIAHRGMIASDYSPTSELYKHFSQYSTSADNVEEWPYPVRPISSDQTQNLNFMPTLHQAISSLAPTASKPIQESHNTCKCKSGIEGKCIFNGENKLACTASSATINCLSGPNPVDSS